MKPCHMLSLSLHGWFNICWWFLQLSGQVEDCCCDVPTVESLVDRLHPQLLYLLKRDFFKFFKVSCLFASLCFFVFFFEYGQCCLYHLQPTRQKEWKERQKTLSHPHDNVKQWTDYGLTSERRPLAFFPLQLARRIFFRNLALLVVPARSQCCRIKGREHGIVTLWSFIV